jgi:hypothetical protein
VLTGSGVKLLKVNRASESWPLLVDRNNRTTQNTLMFKSSLFGTRSLCVQLISITL